MIKNKKKLKYADTAKIHSIPGKRKWAKGKSMV